MHLKKVSSKKKPKVGPKVIAKLTQKTLVDLVKKHGTVVVKFKEYDDFCSNSDVKFRFRKLTAKGKAWYRTIGYKGSFFGDIKTFKESCYWQDFFYDHDRNPSVATLVREMFKYDTYDDRDPVAVYAKGKIILKVKRKQGVKK